MLIGHAHRAELTSMAFTYVRRLDASDPDHSGPIDKLAFEIVPPARLARGDLVLCVAGETVPASGMIVEGSAAIADASAALARERVHELRESPPRIRRGARLVSGYLVIRVAE